MPLQSRMTRTTTPVGENLTPSVGTKVDENVSPRRRTMSPAAAGAQADLPKRQDDLDEIDKAAQALGDAVSGAADDAGVDDAPPFGADPGIEVGGTQHGTGTPEPVPTEPVATTPAPTARRGRPARATVPAPAGSAEDLRAALRSIEQEVREHRKEYEAVVKPLIENYKTISARLADLLPG